MNRKCGNVFAAVGRTHIRCKSMPSVADGEECVHYSSCQIFLKNIKLFVGTCLNCVVFVERKKVRRHGLLAVADGLLSCDGPACQFRTGFMICFVWDRHKELAMLPVVLRYVCGIAVLKCQRAIVGCR